jgi:hypothetical protein
MKKILLATLLIGMISGCTNSEIKKDCTKKGTTKGIYATDLRASFVEEIDGCEYIVSSSNHYIIHKYNCANPIHKGGEK